MSNSQEGPLVSARDVRKSYVMGKGTVEVLRGVTLTVPRGDFQALRGASGAGKSTLLHLIGGLDTPNSGEIWFGDRDLARMSRNDLAEFRNLRIGLIFQGYHLFPELDAVENVALPARMARKNATRVAERARMLLKRVGLGARMEHRPSEMSGGEQQRVAIARALINEPELIIADEPTGNLDSHTGQEIIELLCSLREENGTTLLIATHDLKVAARAPKVIHLVDGQIESMDTSDPAHE
jgi:ABC-type lipoprotein export system ATPase subunit